MANFGVDELRRMSGWTVVVDIVSLAALCDAMRPGKQRRNDDSACLSSSMAPKATPWS